MPDSVAAGYRPGREAIMKSVAGALRPAPFGPPG